MSDNKVKVTTLMDAELVVWIDKEVETRRLLRELMLLNLRYRD
jgi:hypothetical protein